MVDFKTLSDEATPGEWSFSPSKYEIHPPNLECPEFGGPVCRRTNRWDGEFIIALANAYRSGELIEASTVPQTDDLQKRVAELEGALRSVAHLVDAYLWTQREKVQDAGSIARDALEDSQ